MHRLKRPNDAVHLYMSELSSKVVAESGRPEDRYHLGKLVLQGLKEDPDFVLQIDGSTDESETNASVLERSVRCAIGLQNIGLQAGDVIVLMAPNHNDLCIPFYAAFYLGVIIAPVDRTLTVNELQGSFSVNKPKAVFCQSEKASDIQTALKELGLDAQVITFDKSHDDLDSFAEFLEKFGGDMPVEEFQPTDIDPEDAIAVLIATSGTTGLPKAAAGTHKNFAISGPYWWCLFTNFPVPTRMTLIGSPLQWLTAIYHYMFSPILRYTRLQSTLPVTREHAYHLINTYRPTLTTLSPTLMTTLIKPPERDDCDFTCFELILLGGSAVPEELLAEIKEIAPNLDVFNAYGMSELTGMGFHPEGVSCGSPLGCFQYRLVDMITQEDKLKPHEEGELWVKGPAIFKEYYNNPTATEETFAEDRWFRTGDIFYRDENWNFFFVERYKLLLKYKSNHISPVELENVIRQHPGVLDVAVTGIPDQECGDLAVVCVVKRPGFDVEAQEIKDLVRDNLSDAKQLRGGVLFVDEIPMTASTKVHRRKLKEMVLSMEPQ